ncbi:MAG: HAD family hydrolase [Planctomycetes bacterium]|nr:HAD family hydrolase [Planctomycetota bacterium]
MRDETLTLGVVFDVDGTLYHDNLLRSIIGAHLLFFLVIRPLRTLRDIRIIFHYRSAQEYLRYTSTAIMYNSQVRRAAETSKIDIEEISSRICFWMEKLPLRFMRISARRYLIRFIQRWHNLGVPMASYSDYPAEAKLKSLGLESMFQCNVCSTDTDVAALKPKPKGFILAASRLGISPQNIIYIGNREDVDAAGARNASMNSIIIKRKLKFPSFCEHSKTRLRCLDTSFRQRYVNHEKRR